MDISLGRLSVLNEANDALGVRAAIQLQLLHVTFAMPARTRKWRAELPRRHASEGLAGARPSIVPTLISTKIVRRSEIAATAYAAASNS
jgi:hypothetical protein